MWKLGVKAYYILTETLMADQLHHVALVHFISFLTTPLSFFFFKALIKTGIRSIIETN